MINSTSSPDFLPIFESPETEGSLQSEKFRERMANELKGISWPAGMPDLIAKITELLNIQIPDTLISCWKKTHEIEEALEESEKHPDETNYLELAEHSITTEYHPYVEIRMKSITVKKMEFKIVVSLNLKGFILKIHAGELEEIQTGACEIEGSAHYEDLKFAERKLKPFPLPGVITPPHN